GWCEQVEVKIGMEDKALSNFTRLVHEPRVHEKNWMPIMDNTGRWMYRCDEITDGRGSNSKLPEPRWDIGQLAGGSQLVRWKDGWIAIVHEARTIPDQSARFYMHRFVEFTSDFQLRR